MRPFNGPTYNFHLPIFLLVIILFACFISACSTFKGEKNTALNEYGEADLYKTAQRFISKRFWEDAIEVLQKLEENYPFGKYAEQAQLELIYAYVLDAGE